jgi:pimeloyl-ACP methyl ester carboxylesterase
MVTHKNARTCFVEAGLSRYAYRRFGKDAGTPIILLQHFTGGLDHWDPLLTDGLARDRNVIIVDNAGVGSSSGSAPNTIEGMADCVKQFVDALSLETFDLLGFSMGGMVAQAFAKTNRERIRRLVLVGTSPRGGDPSPHQAEVSQRARGSAGEEDIAWLFFGRSSAALSAAKAFWHRRHERTEDVDPPSGIETIMAQVAAGRDWLRPHGDRFADLAAITMPVLVVNGSDDVMLPTINTFYLQQNLPNAQLIIYPDSGHAAHFQYPDLFLRHLRIFLDDAPHDG